MNAKDATYIEHLFVATVGLPIALMGAAGLCRFLQNENNATIEGKVSS
jgi:hypothetical protein